MSYRRKRLSWLNELAWRRFMADKMRRFGEEATELSSDEFISRGNALIKEKRDRDYVDLDLRMMEPLPRRLHLEKELNTILRDFAYEPKGDGQFEYELHWYRITNILYGILQSSLYRAEDGHDIRDIGESYNLDSKSIFAELDAALPLIDQHTDEELFQLVHKLQGRAHLSPDE